MSRHDIPQRTHSLNESHTPQIIALIPSLLSPDNNIRKQAESTLKTLSLANNYLCCLLQIISQEKLQFQLRQFCSIEFKNGVERHWRKHAPYAIQPHEKDILRSQLLSAVMHLTTESIFDLMSFNLARIARMDCPNEWPSMFDNVVSLINDSNDGTRLKAVVVLKDVVKQLATKKLMDSKAYFREVSAKLLPFVSQIWDFYMSHDYKLLQEYISQPNVTESGIQKLYSQIKPYFAGTEACISIVANLIDHGFKSLTQDAMNVLQRLLEHTQKLYHFFDECKKRNIRNSITSAVVHCLHKFLRPIIAIIPRHQLDFVPLLESYIQFALNLISQNMPHESMGFIEDKYDQLLVRSMTLLRIILTMTAYDATVTSKLSPSPQHIIHEKCFNLQTIGNLVNILISKFMILSQHDLEKYDENPEEFLKDQESDWDGTVKSTAETLFMTLMDTYESVCGEQVTKLLQHIFSITQEANTSTNMSTREKVVLRESAYSALGWGCYYFNNFIDSDQLFASQLSPEALNPSTDRLIRRKIIWTLGRWVERMSSETRVATYRLFQGILEQGQADLVMQLTIFYALNEMVDDFDFDAQSFVPFTEFFTKHIFRVLALGHIEDSKLKLLRFLTGLVCKLKEHNTQDVGHIILQLSSLWQSSQSFLIQTAVVSLMQELVQNASPAIWMKPDQIRFIAHLVRCGIDPDQKGSVYYCEEALELYRILLVHCEIHFAKDAHAAQAVSEAFLPLIQYVFNTLERSSEYIVKALTIISNHICLNADQFLNRYSQQMAQLVYNVIGNFKPTTLHQMSICLDVIMSRYPEQSASLFGNSLRKILECLLGNKEEGLVVSQYVLLECRLILQDKNIFFKLMQELSSSSGSSVETLLAQFIVIASGTVDHIWTVHHRMIVALALLSFYPSQSSEMLNAFVTKLLPACVTMHTDCELVPEEEMLNEGDPHIPLSAHDEKMRNANIPQAVQHTLLSIRSSFGDDNFRQLISKADPNVFETLRISPL